MNFKIRNCGFLINCLDAGSGTGIPCIHWISFEQL